MSASSGAIRAGKAYVEIGANDGLLARGLKAAQAKIRAFGQSIRGVSMRVGLAAAAIAAPLMLTAKTFADFEQAMAELRSASNPTAEQFDAIKAKILELSKTTGQEPTKIAESFTELLKAGMKVESVLDGAGEAAVKFAKVGGLDTANAAIVLSDSMNIFKKEALSATQAANTLSAAADASSTNIMEMTQASAMGSSQFGKAGLPMKDFSTSLALLAKEGIKGSDAGTSLKTMMIRLMAPADEGAKVFEQLGINVRDANERMLPMRDIVAELQAKLAGLGPAARDAALKDLFGSDALRAAQILSGTGTKGWDAMQASMSQSLDLHKKYAIVTDTLHGKYTALKASISRMLIVLGEALMPVLVKKMALISTIIAKSQAWILTNRKLIGVILAVVARLGAVATVVAVLSGLVVGIASTIGFVATAIGIVLSPLGALLSVAGLVGVAIAGLTTYFFFFTDAGKATLKWMGDLFGIFHDDAIRAIDGVKDALSAGKWMMAARIAWNGVQVIFWRGIVALRELWKTFNDYMASIFDPFLQWFGMSWETVTKFVGTALWDYIVKPAVYAFSVLEALVLNWRTTLSLLWVSIKLDFVRTWEYIKYVLLEVIPVTLGWWARNGIKIFAGFLVAVVGLWLAAVYFVWNWLKDVVPKIVDWMWTVFTKGEDAAVAIGEQIGTAFRRGFEQEVENTGMPDFADRVKSELEMKLEAEQAALKGELGSAIRDQFQTNMAAIESLKNVFGEGAQLRLDELLREREEMIADARVLRGEGPGGGADVPRDPFGKPIPKPDEAVKGIEAAIAGSSRGIFNPRAIRSLIGDSNLQKRIAAACEESAEHLKKIAYNPFDNSTWG